VCQLPDGGGDKSLVISDTDYSLLGRKLFDGGESNVVAKKLPERKSHSTATLTIEWPASRRRYRYYKYFAEKADLFQALP